MIDEALGHYLTVTIIPNNPFLEQTFLSVSSIYLQKEVYDSAYYFYEKLETVAEMPENTLQSIIGQLRSAYNMGDAMKTIEAADKVLSSEMINSELAREATFMSGKSNFAMENYDDALNSFRQVAIEVTTGEGAESKYRVAQILFMNGLIEDSEKVINEFIEQNTPHQYWMARMIILLADISLSRGDEFHARATLQSVADYYIVEDDGILDEVRAKLAELNLENESASDTIDIAIDKNDFN
jgi:tetratricopeptide (TPR) repeat protein